MSTSSCVLKSNSELTNIAMYYLQMPLPIQSIFQYNKLIPDTMALVRQKTFDKDTYCLYGFIYLQRCAQTQQQKQELIDTATENGFIVILCVKNTFNLICFK